MQKYEFYRRQKKHFKNSHSIFWRCKINFNFFLGYIQYLNSLRPLFRNNIACNTEIEGLTSFFFLLNFWTYVFFLGTWGDLRVFWTGHTSFSEVPEMTYRFFQLTSFFNLPWSVNMHYRLTRVSNLGSSIFSTSITMYSVLSMKSGLTRFLSTVVDIRGCVQF